MKKYIELVFLMLLFSLSFASFVYADDDTNNYIDLVTAKKMALENSRSMETQKLFVKIAEVSKEIAKDVYDNTSGYQNEKQMQNYYLYLINKKKEIQDAGGDTSGIDSRIAEAEFSISQLRATLDKKSHENLKDDVRDKKYDYEDSLRAKEDYEKLLMYLVEQYYTNILRMEDSLNNLRKTYDFQLNSLKIKRLQFELGMCSQTDVDELATETSDIGNSINSLIKDINVLKGEFNDLLGRKYDSKLSLVKFNVNVVPIQLNRDKLLTLAEENYAKIYQLQRDIEKMNDDLDDENINDDDKLRNLLELEIQQTQHTLDDAKKELKTNINNILKEYEDKRKAYQIAELSLNTNTKKYNWDKKKFELGMISKIEIEASELAYLKALNNKISAGYDYLLAKHKIHLAEQGVFMTSSNDATASTNSEGFSQ